MVKHDKPRTTKTNCEVNANGTQQEKKIMIELIIKKRKSRFNFDYIRLYV